MAVLLVPGGRVVMCALAIPFRGAEALGHLIYFRSATVSVFLTLALWLASAFITLRFWARIWMRLRRGKPGLQEPT